MTDTDAAKEALERLLVAAAKYDETKAAHEDAREQAAEAVVAALKAGATPTQVTRDSPFTDAYVRKIARDAGVAPSKPGIKPQVRQMTRARRFDK
jgi:hypothetical protein